jgi:hypothetical protein
MKCRNLLVLLLVFCCGNIHAEAFQSLFQPSLIFVKLEKVQGGKKGHPEFNMMAKITLENVTVGVLTGTENFRAYVTDLDTDDQSTLDGSVDYGLGPGDSVACTLSNGFLDDYSYKPNKIKILLLRVLRTQDALGSWTETTEPVWNSFTMTRSGNEYQLDASSRTADDSSGNTQTSIYDLSQYSSASKTVDPFDDLVDRPTSATTQVVLPTPTVGN